MCVCVVYVFVSILYERKPLINGWFHQEIVSFKFLRTFNVKKHVLKWLCFQMQYDEFSRTEKDPDYLAQHVDYASELQN